jgi:damage-control phosphatase, subfamily I
LTRRSFLAIHLRDTYALTFQEEKSLLKATLDCLACIVSQAVRAARVATDDVDAQRRIVDEVARRIPGMSLEESPAAISNAVYQIAADITGNADPYRAFRREQNEFALSLEPELRSLIRNSPDPLQTALHLSAAGNIIDLGVEHAGGMDVRAAIDQCLSEQFAVDHGEAFHEALSRARDIVFLLDNAGEIVFDKILIEELLKSAPVTAVVKAGPIINDVVMEDAVQVGLTEICPVIDNGGAYVGSPLNLVPGTFVERLRQADMIIGKGQGNYETVDEFPGDVFLILRAKCPTIAKHMCVEYGQVALISTRVRRG